MYYLLERDRGITDKSVLKLELIILSLDMYGSQDYATLSELWVETSTALLQVF